MKVFASVFIHLGSRRQVGVVVVFVVAIAVK